MVEGSKPNLLFIHGFATGPEIWREQFVAFSSKYNILTDTKTIEAQESVVIVAWSMGGWKAIELCLEYPQKVKALVLVSAFTKYLKSDEYPYGVSPALLRNLEKKFRSDYREGMDYFYDLLFRDKKWHQLIDKLPVPAKEDMERWFEKLQHEDKRHFIPKLKLPVLLLHGENDQISPVGNSAYLHDNLPNAELVVLKGVGHAPMIEAPDEFNRRLTDFLTKHA